MKKVEITKAKLVLKKEKVTDLINPKSQQDVQLSGHAQPTTTVLDHTKILCF